MIERLCKYFNKNVQTLLIFVFGAPDARTKDVDAPHQSRIE